MRYQKPVLYSAIAIIYASLYRLDYQRGLRKAQAQQEVGGHIAFLAVKT
jgi:hypothetical protein